MAHPLGTEAEGRALIGTTTPPRKGGVMVDQGLIRLLCGSVEDANPRYWQEGASPPGMLFTWIIDLPWSPGAAAGAPPMVMPIPLPGDQVVNVRQQAEFHGRIAVGDALSMTATLMSISEEKSTELGRGHFVVTQVDVRNQNEDLVAVVTNTAFRYSREAL